MNTIDTPIMVIDREHGAWYVTTGPNPGETTEHPHEDLVSGRIFDTYPHCKTMVVEYAHLHPRVGRSLAQVYSIDDLRELERVASERGVEIRVFPQTLTYRAINEESGVADKSSTEYNKYAAWSIYMHLHRYPRTFAACKRWRAPTDADDRRNAARQTIRRDINRRLNEMRTYPRYDEHDEVKMALAALELMVPELDAAKRELLEVYFGISLSKTGVRLKRSGIKWPSVMGIYCAVFDDTGNLRRDQNGRFIGVNGVTRVLKLSAFHMNAGVARSNLMYFGQASREKALGLGNANMPDAGDNSAEANALRVQIREKRAVLRRDFQRAVRVLIRAFRDYGLERTGSMTAATRALSTTASTRAPG